ncbi:hypothetical protein F53441_3233 [Fusarium austroafricanum]|uniref:Uncharacterized protein n=1 Tax=Fusarium austroafricanum TaxID=2364996 RepID=A0A8H4P223_9HYPO|nr:hypothetical protein F53441_3233 [Fusarium austroafricanum]
MVYYALLKYDISEPHYRYLLAAPNAETIDEWWREASSKDAEHVKRLAPDYYSWGSGAQAYNLGPSFEKKIMYTLLNDRDARIMSTFNQPERTDVISGGSYYIRSKSNPSMYWMAKDGQIWATTQGRTRFIFRIDAEDDKNSTVLIGKDYISITAVGENNQKYVSVSDNGELVLGGHSCRMYYNDLKKNFLAQGETGHSGSALITKNEGHGEEWELVK